MSGRTNTNIQSTDKENVDSLTSADVGFADPRSEPLSPGTLLGSNFHMFHASTQPRRATEPKGLPKFELQPHILEGLRRLRQALLGDIDR